LNLPDLINRKDRAVAIESGAVEVKNFGLPQRRMRGIELAPATRLRLKDAHTFNLLRGFPTDIHWQLALGQAVRISAEPHLRSLSASVLAQEDFTSGEPRSLLLNWPLWVVDSGFDLLIEAVGEEPVMLVVGRLLDPRAKMRPLIKGTGLELGPGLAPRIRPAEGINIEYVEEKTPDQWQEVYGHGKASMAELTPDVLERYRVGSALTLAEWDAESLDFIFSNHVFEHLANPLQVLRNWLGRLKPGGAVLAVVPDTRFTFDLRQRTSTLEEMLAEERVGGHEVTDEKYERWCEFTAPYNTVENLKQRNYSIHVHYYTPELFRRMADLLIQRGECSGVFLDTVPNNKEFGVVLRR
jgi:SAM-dependent methyltransferase